MGKSLSNGFGVVRKLTNESQKEVFKALDDAQIGHKALRRKPPLHLTLVGFIKMSRREQTAFHAGMNVTRLEERLEQGVQHVTPRKAVPVELGSVATVGSFIYAEVIDDRIIEEQLQLVGQVAMHGISPMRINRRVVPPHIGIGYGQQAPLEELRERVEEAISGQTVALQRWDVYPERYA